MCTSCPAPAQPLPRPAAQATMPVTVFVVGVMLGTETFSTQYALNMLIVGVGVATASFGECALPAQPTHCCALPA